MKGSKTAALYLYILILIIMGIFPGQWSANSNQILSIGQSIYVPVYSHIYHGDKEKPFNLTATLSIRNTNIDSDKNQTSLHRSVAHYSGDCFFLDHFLKAAITPNRYS